MSENTVNIEKPKRVRRSLAEVIAETQAKIERLKMRAENQEVKKSVLTTDEGDRIAVMARAANGLIRLGKSTNNEELVSIGNDVIARITPLANSLGFNIPSWDDKRGRKRGQAKSDSTESDGDESEDSSEG